MRTLRRYILSTLAALWLVLGAFAQGDDGLARDFEKLSAKERARIAKEEQEGALNDAAYQAVMVEAEKFFQAARYEESMAKFKEARVLRPYNVYPKVKIADLEILIAKRDAAIAKEEAMKHAAEEVVPVVAPPAATKVEVPAPPVPSPVVTPVATPIQPKPVVPAKPEVRSKPVNTIKERPVQEQKKQPELQPEPNAEVGQRVYKEGRSVVVESRIEEGGRVVVYRKVTHPWGAVDHFKDGSAIPARAYIEAMEGR